MRRLTVLLSILFCSMTGSWSQSRTPNPLKELLAQGGPIIGTTLTIPSAEVAAVLAEDQFDFLWIEMEHSPITLETAREMILATRGLKAIPITRVPSNEVWLAKRALDIGSYGVIFPFSNNIQLVKQAVAACKYPPQGVRGYSPRMAATRWGMPTREYIEKANDNVLVIPIIEHREAIEQIEEIAAIPGIDVLFIGANDLSFSYGVGGQLTHPLVEEAVDRVVSAAAKYNIPVGYPSGSPERMRQMIERGIRFFQAGNDIGLMRGGARQLFQGLKESEADEGLKIEY